MKKTAASDSLKISKKAYRAGTIERQEDGRIKVIFSTENPVIVKDMRGNDYIETFEHSERAIDRSGLVDGHKVIFKENHHKNGPINLGSVINIGFDLVGDKVPGVGKHGFGELDFNDDSVFGKAARSDYENDHRRFVSLGADRIKPPLSVGIDEATGMRTMTFAWRLFEISACDHPIDIGTKAIRSAGDGEEDEYFEVKLKSRRSKPMLTPEQLKAKEEALAAQEAKLAIDTEALRSAGEDHRIKVGDDKAKVEQHRKDTIDGAAQLAITTYGLDAAVVFAEANRSKGEDVSAGAYGQWIMKQKAEMQKTLAAEAQTLGLTDREQQDFSLAKSIRSLHDGTFRGDNKDVSYEFRVCQDAEALQPSEIGPVKRGQACITLPRDIVYSTARRSAMMGSQVDMQAFGQLNQLSEFNLFNKIAQRSMSVDQATKGGAWTAEGLSQSRYIDFLNVADLLSQLNITRIPGLTTDLTFAVLDGIQTAYVRGEHEDATLSDLTTSTRKMTPRLVSSGTKMSWLLKVQGAAMAIEAIMEMKLAIAQATKKNQLWLYGTGINKEPLGVTQTSGINTVAGGTNGLAPTQDNYINMRTNVAAVNGGTLPGRSIFLLNAVTVGKNQRVAVESGQTARIMRVDHPAGTPLSLIGELVIQSNHLRSNLTKGSGTSLSESLFINPNESYEGQWGTTRILLDDKTNAASDEIITYIHDYYDFMLGYPAIVSYMNDLITT